MAPTKAGFAPDLQKFLKSLKGQPLETSIETLISLFKRRQIQGPEACAIATAHILLHVVAKAKYADAEQLLEKVQKTGKRLVEAQPKELVVGNIVRRILGLIRDEAGEDRNDEVSETPSEAPSTPTTTEPSLLTPDPRRSSANAPSSVPKLPRLTSFSSVPAVPKSLLHILAPSAPIDLGPGSGASTPGGYVNPARISALRSEVIDGIEEIKDEIGQVDEQIAAAADIQIHPQDYVLVHEPSKTVIKFLLKAALKRKFTVFVGGDAPHRGIEEDRLASFRQKLTATGVTVVNVKGTSMTAYMARINKVILSARAVIANGGVVVDAGAGSAARIAKSLGIPVIVLTGVYRISPENPPEGEALIEWGGASPYVKFADGDMVSGVNVRTALTEFVPPQLVDTYITNVGTHSRDHLPSIINDHYKREDVDFHLV